MPPRSWPGPGPLLAFVVLAAPMVWSIGLAPQHPATDRPAGDGDAVPAWVGDPDGAGPTRISGRVVGAPGATVHVGADLADPAAWTRTITATATGSFVVDGLPTGRYQVWAQDPGRASRVHIIDTAAGAGEGALLVPHLCRSVRAQIVDAAGRPMASATLEVGGHVVARADAGGAAEWCAPPRPVRVLARADGLVPVWVELAADASTLTAQLEAGRELTVELPADAGVIEAGPDEGSTWPVTVVPAQFGPTRVRIPSGPATASAVLRLRRGRMVIAVTPITADTSRARLIPGPARPAEVELAPAQSAIIGRVVIERAAVADAEIVARTSSGQLLGRAWSEPDGKYRLAVRGLAPGRAAEVLVEAVAAPSPLRGKRRLMVLPGSNLSAIEIRLVDPAAAVPAPAPPAPPPAP